MSKPTADIRCKFCLRDHSRWSMCEPVRKVLDTLAERGRQFDMPTLEFPEPIYGGNTADELIMRQLVVKAAILNMGDVPVPALVFTGQDGAGRPLPNWIYPGDDDDLDRAVKLVSDVADMAKRGARKARGETE